MKKTSEHMFSAVSLGYIDLSKRRVSPEEAIKCEDKFTKSKTVSENVPRKLALFFILDFFPKKGF